MLGCSYGYQIAEDKQGGRLILFPLSPEGKMTEHKYFTKIFSPAYISSLAFKKLKV